MFRIENLSLSYGTRRVLSGVNLEAPEGSLTAVIGPNGAGKSSLMRAALGLTPFTGRVTLDGVDLLSQVAKLVHRLLGPSGERF